MLTRLTLMAALAITLILPDASEAQGRERLGYGRLIVNDLIGDGRDRWRTGSYVSSRVWGPAWTGSLPSDFGSLIEFRLKGEVFSPANLRTPAPGDRRLAGAWSFGAHTHFQPRSTELSVGANAVIIGPQTGLIDFQKWLHERLGAPIPSDPVVANQIPDQIRAEGVFEAGRTIPLTARTRIRPFVEARAGVETLARAGFDVTIGPVGAGELWVRDPVTGFRYRVVQDPTPGMAFVFGADTAKVWDSVFLPKSDGYVLSDMRNRVRVGMHWQGKKSAIFYGLTWLGKEFTAQADDQLTGAIRLNLKF